MHAVLRDFVDAASRRLLIEAEKLIERAGAFADRVGLFDGLGNVSLREDHRLAQLLTSGKLRRDSRRKSAAGTVGIGALDVIAAEHFDS